MKELSIEEKAKRYDELLAKLQEAKVDNNVCDDRYCCVIDVIVPELKEREDERIRKSLINYFMKIAEEGDTSWNTLNPHKVIAWLEKQGEHAKFCDSIQVGDKVTRNEDGVLVNLSQLKRVAKKDEKQGEKKTANKVEPTFNVGDWVVLTAGELLTTLQIVKVDTNKKLYLFNDDSYLPIVDEECLHLWSIQDAKDGDVLYLQKDGKEHIIIYKGVIKERFRTFVSAYCAYNGIVDAFCFADVSRYVDIAYGGIVPATDEQCDTLFAKMKDAGYEWDAENKELKKIKQKPIEWSKEDDELYNDLSDTYFYNDEDYPEETYKLMLKRVLDWTTNRAKFLRPQTTWKPSDEQIKAVRLARSFVTDDFDENPTLSDVLVELEEQLKKLREE